MHAGAVFASFDAFIRENSFAALPRAPAGFSLRQVAAMPQEQVRLITDRSGNALLVLCLSGDIYRIALPDGTPTRILEGTKIAAGAQFLGIALDDAGRLYLVGNRFDFDVTPAMNHVTIYRTAPLA